MIAAVDVIVDFCIHAQNTSVGAELQTFVGWEPRGCWCFVIALERFCLRCDYAAIWLRCAEKRLAYLRQCILGRLFARSDQVTAIIECQLA